MCRAEAKIAAARIPEMRAAGATRIVVLVKENLEEEVAEFRKDYWPDEVFMDSEKRFFLALGGGEAYKPYSVASFLAMLVNPFSKSRTKGALSQADQEGVPGNMKGEGFISGGVYVVRQDGKAAYAFLEEDTGDRAPVDDVVEAVKAAVRGEEYNLAPLVMPGGTQENTRMTWKEWAGRTTGPDGYQVGDITRGIVASVSRSKCSNASAAT